MSPVPYITYHNIIHHDVKLSETETSSLTNRCNHLFPESEDNLVELHVLYWPLEILFARLSRRHYVELANASHNFWMKHYLQVPEEIRIVYLRSNGHGSAGSYYGLHMTLRRGISIDG